MPYIKNENNRRAELREGAIAQNAGELNYQIFAYVKKVNGQISQMQIVRYVDAFIGKSPNYQRYNDMTGVLVRCYKEIKRRLGLDIKFLISIMDMYDTEINKYEDVKIQENGDVEDFGNKKEDTDTTHIK